MMMPPNISPTTAGWRKRRMSSPHATAHASIVASWIESWTNSRVPIGTQMLWDRRSSAGGDVLDQPAGAVAFQLERPAPRLNLRDAAADLRNERGMAAARGVRAIAVHFNAAAVELERLPLELAEGAIERTPIDTRPE